MTRAVLISAGMMGVGLWLAPVGVVRADPSADLRAVVKGWEKRQQQIRSVYYRVSGTSTHPKGKWTGDKAFPPSVKGPIPPEDFVSPIEGKILFDFERNRVRKETRRMAMFSGLAKFALQVQTQTYDGKTIKVFEPRDANTTADYAPSVSQPELWIQTRTYGGLFFQPDDRPLLFAHGIVPVPTRGVSVGHFRLQPDERFFRLADRGRIGGRDCLILRTIPTPDSGGVVDEFWVDLARDAAVCRWVHFVKQQAEMVVDIDYQLLQSHWLPKAWRYSWNDVLAKPARLHYSENRTVDEISIDVTVSDDRFDVTLAPHMLVRDVGNALNLTVDSDGKTLIPFGQSSNRRFRWVWALLTLLILTGLVVVLSKYRRLRRS